MGNRMIKHVSAKADQKLRLIGRALSARTSPYSKVKLWFRDRGLEPLSIIARKLRAVKQERLRCRYMKTSLEQIARFGWCCSIYEVWNTWV